MSMISNQNPRRTGFFLDIDKLILKCIGQSNFEKEEGTHYLISRLTTELQESRL